MQIKLLPDSAQSKALRDTLETANAACNRLSQLAWEVQEFRQFPLHKRFYRQLRDEFKLSSQMVIRLNAKVADAYQLDRAVQRVFRRHGSITYDNRILRLWLDTSKASLWTLAGRQKMPFVCGERQRALLRFPLGEADLILRDGQWFLNVSVDVPEEGERAACDVLGVDLGVVNIAADSDGNRYSGAKVNQLRQRHRALRRKLQRKGTKSAKRLLRHRRRKESRFARDTNHVISKRIVLSAKRTNRAIAIEGLTGIRSRIRARKAERTVLHSWSFAELGGMIAYKAKLNGVRLLVVDPRHTSQRCNQCGHTAKDNRKSQSEFVCQQCGHAENADGNGAKNIRLKGLDALGSGVVIRPHAEKINYVN